MWPLVVVLGLMAVETEQPPQPGCEEPDLMKAIRNIPDNEALVLALSHGSEAHVRRAGRGEAGAGVAGGLGCTERMPSTLFSM